MTARKTPKYRLGTIVAERELDLQVSPRKKAKVLVRIGKPKPDGKITDDWYCPIQILGLGEERVKAAYGIDAVQALEMAFLMISADLTLYFQRLHPGKLTWLGEHRLGFPPPETPDDYLRKERAWARFVQKKSKAKVIKPRATRRSNR